MRPSVRQSVRPRRPALHPSAPRTAPHPPPRRAARPPWSQGAANSPPRGRPGRSLSTPCRPRDGDIGERTAPPGPRGDRRGAGRASRGRLDHPNSAPSSGGPCVLGRPSATWSCPATSPAAATSHPVHAACATRLSKISQSRKQTNKELGLVSEDASVWVRAVFFTATDGKVSSEELRDAPALVPVWISAWTRASGSRDSLLGRPAHPPSPYPSPER